jgi:inositol phosphorylceramide mannosyltransferase catalytic subunit
MSAFDTENAIPRKIHQIYYGNDLSDCLRANAQGLQDLNAGWAYRLFDAPTAEDYIATHYGLRVLESYLKLDVRYYAARADLLRYLIVYREGGVYLDIKSRFIGPIEHFVRGDEGYLLSHWRNRSGEIHEGFGLYPELAHVPAGEFQNFHVIAAPNHPFLGAVIERVLRNISEYSPWDAVGRTGVVRVTGPVAYTQAIHPLIDTYPCKIVSNEEEIGLQYSIPEAYPSGPDTSPHYSAVKAPVVRQSAIGDLASRFFVKLREVRDH